MTRANPLVSDALSVLRGRGLAPVVKNGGKHVKIGWFDQGRRHILTVSNSPSDRKARLKSRALLRRLLRTIDNAQVAP